MGCACVCVCGGCRSSRGGRSKRKHFGVELKKIKKCDSSKSIQRALGGGGGQRGGIFMKAIFPSAEQDQNGQLLS